MCSLFLKREDNGLSSFDKEKCKVWYNEANFFPLMFLLVQSEKKLY